MHQVDSPLDKWRTVVLFLTALLVVAADQLTKIWVRSYPEGQSIFEKGFFRLIHVHNTGAAFGLFQDQSFTLTIVAVVGIALLLFWALFAYRRFPLLTSMSSWLALGLILGGAVGNLVDRLRLGHVTDFIAVGIWPAFNIADSATVIGVIILIYSLFRLVRAEKH